MTTQNSSIDHMPDGPWRFDASVTQVFEDMLERSIPQYGVMRDAVEAIAAAYVQPGTAVLDLGCSKGDALAGLVGRFGDANTYVGVEVSAPMVTAARERFAGLPFVEIQDRDLRSGLPVLTSAPSVVLSVLTLMFVPINYRQRLVQEVYTQLPAGGAFILVEKCLGHGSLDDLFVRLYHEMKASNGYTQEAIDRKALALEGVLVPVTARWNEELLEAAGFRTVDCFWRWMNFAGWVAIK